MKKLVVDLLVKAFKKKKIKITREEIESKLEVPPSVDLGDYSFPCFFLADRLKDNPHQIALELRAKIGTEMPTDFDDIMTKGPYINFYLDRKNLARKSVWETISKGKNYAKSKVGKNKKIIFEFSSPNIAKPLGVQHLRSTIVGNSLAKISEFLGYKPIKYNYLGDWGTQFGRILLGYEKYGDEEKLLEDPLGHLSEVYKKANRKSFDEKAKAKFKLLEENDNESLMLWKIFRDRSIEGFEKTYRDLGIKFDFYSGESQSVKNAGGVFEELKNKNIIKKSKGAWIADLKKHNLDILVILKNDGATTYALRDLAEAINRYKKNKFHMMVYETGQEQTLYFKQLFKILELMGNNWAKTCVHVSHGLYLDKKKKKLSTRKGKVKFVRDILSETIELAKKEIKKKSKKINKEELEKRARAVAIAAIFYGDLKINRRNNVVFDLRKFVSFEGDTGPYLLYSYARASSIIRKSGQPGKFKINELSPKELTLVKKLLKYEEITKKSFELMEPSLVANYCYEVAKLFNEFYHAHPVIGSNDEPFRLALVEAFRIVMKSALGLLGIKTLEEM